MSRISRRRLACVSSALGLASVLTLILVTAASAKSRVVHHVSAGGPDACIAFGFEHPGCDANFSLSAIEYADGSVTGQYTDRFAQGDGFHAVLDCLVVDGTNAWVSGVITQGTFTLQSGAVVDLTGFPVATRVKDRGTSSTDPADQISFSFIDDATPCTLKVDYPLLDAPQGQVVVR